VLDTSRFNRRFNSLSDLLVQLLFQIWQHLKTVVGASDYVVASFPVAICDNFRINRCKIFKGSSFEKTCWYAAVFLWSERIGRIYKNPSPVLFVEY
jgi:hypothetical protein